MDDDRTDAPEVELTTLEPKICGPNVTNPKAANCIVPLLPENLRFTTQVYGFISPVVVLLTIVTNTLVCLVLLKKNMRSPTNLLLVAMAISDMLTGLFPVPVFFTFYTLGNYADYVPYEWCHVNALLMLHLPTVCHTASIWLTVALSVQRYVYVCHSQSAKTLCTVPNVIKAIVAVYVAALLSQSTRFVEYSYHPVELQSLVDPAGSKVTGCYQTFVPFIQKNLDLALGLYWWFRVVCIHLVPCAMLVVLNALLFHAMRVAQLRRELLLRQNRKSESRRLAESNLATLMLLTVIGVFLLVEFPLAVLMMTMIYENTFNLQVMDRDERHVASLFINLLILLSYPVNFFIYCGMSRQFRETFKGLFVGKPQGTFGATQTIEMHSKTSIQV